MVPGKPVSSRGYPRDSGLRLPTLTENSRDGRRDMGAAGAWPSRRIAVGSCPESVTALQSAHRSAYSWRTPTSRTGHGPCRRRLCRPEKARENPSSLSIFLDPGTRTSAESASMGSMRQETFLSEQAPARRWGGWRAARCAGGFSKRQGSRYGLGSPGLVRSKPAIVPIIGGRRALIGRPLRNHP